jgi:hypothetical protein
MVHVEDVWFSKGFMGWVARFSQCFTRRFFCGICGRMMGGYQEIVVNEGCGGKWYVFVRLSLERVMAKADYRAGLAVWAEER